MHTHAQHVRNWIIQSLLTVSFPVCRRSMRLILWRGKALIVGTSCCYRLLLFTQTCVSPTLLLLRIMYACVRAHTGTIGGSCRQITAILGFRQAFIYACIYRSALTIRWDILTLTAILTPSEKKENSICGFLLLYIFFVCVCAMVGTIYAYIVFMAVMASRRLSSCLL